MDAKLQKEHRKAEAMRRGKQSLGWCICNLVKLSRWGQSGEAETGKTDSLVPPNTYQCPRTSTLPILWSHSAVLSNVNTSNACWKQKKKKVHPGCHSLLWESSEITRANLLSTTMFSELYSGLKLYEGKETNLVPMVHFCACR